MKKEMQKDTLEMLKKEKSSDAKDLVAIVVLDGLDLEHDDKEVMM